MLCGLTCIIIMILNPFSGKYYVISYARAIKLKKKDMAIVHFVVLYMLL